MQTQTEFKTAAIKRSLRALPLIGLLTIASLPNGARAATCNTDGCTLDLNSSLYIINNQWGKANSPAGFSQSITTSSSTAWRTDFNWPSWPSGDGRNNAVKCYPAAILGWHWGWHFSQAATGLPKQLSASYTATSSFNYSVSFGSGGVGNVAYDLWLTTTSNPDNSTQPTDEIMIWVNSTGGAGPCGGPTVTGINLEGGTWNLHECQIPGYQYVWSFVRQGNTGSATLNLKAFIDYLRNNRGLSSSKYLASIQFGTEVFRGQGNLNVSSYTCSVGTGGGGGGGGSFVKLQNRGTGLCVDGVGRTANGSNCGQYTSGTSFNQHWALETVGSFVKLRNRTTSLYVDGMGRTSNGSACGQWGTSSSFNQQWAQETAGSYFKYRNRTTNLYLDGMGRTANGSDLGQWASSSSFNQQWQRIAQ